MSAEEAGTSMAKMKSAFGMTIPEVATLTDKINLLGNTGAANEKQILGILTRVGPLGGVAGVASGEIAALGSTLAGMFTTLHVLRDMTKATFQIAEPSH